VTKGFLTRDRASGRPARAPGDARIRHLFPLCRSFIPLGALALASCVSVLPDAPPASARYLVADVAMETSASTASWTLGVEEPDATLAYNTAKIALTRAPGRVEYYAGGEWVDRAPRLFGVALVRSFENTGAIRGVGNRLSLPVSTYVLQTDIRRLGVRMTDAEPVAEVEVFARLTNGRSVIHASKLFRASAPVAADSAAAAASALDASLSAIQREIVAWTLDEAERVSRPS
jgi:cholesterol transport system auxiliary component